MRVAGWSLALNREFLAASGRPFRWGRHDCCQFARRCVLAVTGEDRASIFAAYGTKREALEILSTVGGMRGLLIQALGDPAPVARAGRGDVVEIDMGRGPQPAICMGIVSFAPGADRLVFRKTATATCAWKI